MSRRFRSGNLRSSGQRIFRAIIAACRESLPIAHCQGRGNRSTVHHLGRTHQSGALTVTLINSSRIRWVSFLTAVLGLTRNSSI